MRRGDKLLGGSDAETAADELDTRTTLTNELSGGVWLGNTQDTDTRESWDGDGEGGEFLEPIEEH